MEVVIVNDSARVDGGASRIAVSSARGLAQAGIKTSFFAGSGPVSDELEGVRTECLNAINYNARPTKEGALKGLWDKEAETRFQSFVAGLDPAQTIVHFHSNRETLSASVPHAAIEMGFRVVMTCHEYLLGCPYGGFYDQGKHERCPEKGGSLGCWTRPCNGGSYAKKLWFNTRFWRHQRAGIPGRIRDFIFVSEFSQEILRPYLPDSGRFHILENPIEVPSKSSRPLESGQPFLFVGHLHPGKDVLRFARAAQAAGVPARFVGEGPLEEELRKICPDADFPGWVSAAELDGLYRSSRALVFTPIWPETFGLVVFEAAARGLPAIVAEDCAPATFVNNHKGGIVVEQQGGALEAAIERIRDDAECARLGQNAYDAFWAEDRSLAAHVARLTEIYEGMLR